jgi:regulator of protease activity HflC (stomatin/prohibitin superfamily)
MLIIFVIIFLGVILVTSIKIVAEYQRLVVFRLGKVLQQPKGPGITFIIPIIDKPVRVDLREFVLEIPQQTCITKDNAPISIDFLIYLKIIQPVPAVVSIQNFEYLTRGLA